MSRIELRHLRYFQAVAEDLSFSKAARRLCVAQPALSRAVKDLESHLSVLLLERTRHHVRLTAAGSLLLRETGGVLNGLEELVGRVRRTAAGEEGELRLGYIGPPVHAYLGRLLHEYRRRYPRVALHLEERTPERVWEMVAQGRLSAGITRPVLGQEPLGLQTLLLRKEILGVVVRQDHPFAGRKTVPWQALLQRSLVILARREGMGLHDAVLAACRQAGFAPRLAHTPSLIGTVLCQVEAGVGVGVVTDSILGPASPLRWVPLRPRQHVPLVLVWQSYAESPAVRRFRELLGEWMRSGMMGPPEQASSVVAG
ncbi:MAG: LysR family transcriptional regulator [Limisphaerales bacterium]